MERAVPVRSVLFLFAASLLAAAGCRSWERDRREFVEPFNRFLHRDYPRAIAGRDLESVLAFYDPALAALPAFRSEKKAFLDRFQRIDYADDVMEEVERESGERVRVLLFLRVRGIDPSGSPLSHESRWALLCAGGGAGFRIVEERILEERSIVPSPGEPRFSEESEARGLVFSHRSGGLKDRWGRIQRYTAGAGLAAGDYDDDGFDDLYLVSGTECRLFRNRGDGSFEDVTGRCRASKPPGGEGRSGTFGDYDNDGRLDIFVGVLDAPNLLLRQNGDGTFTDRAAQAGLRPTLETTGACFADFNRDGHLDLYIVNGGNLLRLDPEPMHNALNAAPNVLYLSRGDGTFADRTVESGVGHTGWALTVAAQDYDLDGDDDLFVGNDVGFSVLYRNRGDGVFDDVSQAAGITRRGTAMGASWGDPDGDGYPDLFVAGMFSNSRWVVDLASYPAPAPWYVNLVMRSRVKAIVKEMFNGNCFYQNRGDGTFRDTASSRGIINSGWAWGGAFLDYDNDGREDIYVLNSFLSGPDKQDL